MKKTIILSITLFLILSTPTKGTELYFSIIPESITWDYETVEFKIKITNPQQIKKRMRIKATCTDKGKIYKEKEKDYEVTLTEDETQMYISGITKEKCTSIKLQTKIGNFWK